MNGPDGLMAVASLQRCLERKDYAGAARLITLRATADGLEGLAAHAGRLWQSEAERAYRESVAAWRAEHEQSLRRQQEREVLKVVALVAEAVRESRESRESRSPFPAPPARSSDEKRAA